jgi:hypothetical protein
MIDNLPRSSIEGLPAYLWMGLRTLVSERYHVSMFLALLRFLCLCSGVLRCGPPLSSTARGGGIGDSCVAIQRFCRRDIINIGRMELRYPTGLYVGERRYQRLPCVENGHMPARHRQDQGELNGGISLSHSHRIGVW